MSSDISVQSQFMEVRGERGDEWTRFETPSSVDHGAFVCNDQIFFCNQRGEVFVAHFVPEIESLKVTKVALIVNNISCKQSFLHN